MGKGKVPIIFINWNIQNKKFKAKMKIHKVFRNYLLNIGCILFQTPTHHNRFELSWKEHMTIRTQITYVLLIRSLQTTKVIRELFYVTAHGLKSINVSVFIIYIV